MEREGQEERRGEEKREEGQGKERKRGKRASERERAELQGKPGRLESLTYWIGPFRACVSESKNLNGRRTREPFRCCLVPWFAQG
jgi:hypothetical protein